MATACPTRARLSSAVATVTAPMPPSSPSSISMLQQRRRRPSAPRRCRLLLVSASSGKGFGGDNKSSSSSSSSAKKGNKKDETPPLLRQALDRASPIDPREASRGRVDVATVKSWKVLDVSSSSGVGKGGNKNNAAALGELELKSFVPGGGSSVGEDAPPASSPPQPTLASQPLYEALARRLAVLQASGALAEEQPETDANSSKRAAQRRKLPRFEDWRWNERRYVQFLADCLEVHSALESAVGEALRAAEGVFSRGGEGGTTESGGSSAGVASLSSPSSSSSQQLAAFAALSYLGPSAGLSRAEEIAEDLAAIFGTASSSSSGGSGSASPSPPASAPKPSAAASATARYLLDLGFRAARELVSEADEEEELGAGGTGGAARFPAGNNSSRRKEKEKRAAAGDASSAPPPPASASAALRLLANCYSLHVTHLTTGMRVGAAASEALGLLRRKAAGFYQTYPEDLSLAPRRPPLLLSLSLSPPSPSPSQLSPGVEDNKRIVDPLRAFRSAVDGAGRALSSPPPSPSTSASAPLPPTPPTPPPTPPLPSSLLLLGEVEGELVAAVRRAAALFEPLASAEP